MAKKINPKPQAKVAPRPIVPNKPEKPKKKLSLTTLLCIVLAGLSLLVYANTLKNGFVLDDNVVTTKNKIVKQGLKGIPELLVTPRTKGLSFNKSDNYRPLTLIMFAVEYQFFGENAAVGHFFNILFFAGCVILLFLFLDKLFERKKTVVVFIAALLFAVHPIHTEVVANIKSRDEIMCFFLGFLSLNIFLEYMQKGKGWQLALGVLSLFLAFLSKETVITFLAIVPLIFFFYRNESRKRAVFITLGTVAASIVFIIIRTSVLNAYNCNTTSYQFIDNALVGAPSIAIRIATALVILGKYIILLMVPYPLNNDYCYNSIQFVGFGNIWVLLSLAAYVGMTILAVYRFIKNPKDEWAFGIIFFLVTLSLFSNIPFLIGSQMGERFVFFASVGFCLVAALAIEKWILGKEVTMQSFAKNKVALVVLVPVCLLFSGATIARNNDWVDNYTLFKTDLAKAPNDARLNFYLGDELIETIYATETDTIKQKQIIAEGIPYLERAIAIYPQYSDAHTELGKAYFEIHSYDSATNHFISAMIMNPYQYITASNLYSAVINVKRYKDAIAAYKIATSINPEYAGAFYYLGACLLLTEQYDSAAYYFGKTLVADPKYPDGEMQLGVVYAQQNKFDLAEPHFIKAMEQNPKDVNAINNVGVAYLNTGKVPQAIEMFKKAVAADPKYVEGYSKMGRAYFQLKQYQLTIESMNKALSIDPKDVKDIPYIALSYKALGNMDMAAKYEAVARQYYHDFKL